MIHVVENSTNTMTLPERRLWNRARVHVITRKEDGLRWVCGSNCEQVY